MNANKYHPSRWLIAAPLVATGLLFFSKSYEYQYPILSLVCFLVSGAMLLASFSIFVILGSRHDKVTKRRIARRCVSCGYDVRASKGRCPECGMEIQEGL